MIKAILFDMDGTIMNTIDDLADSMNCILKKYGYSTHPTEEYKYLVGNGIRNLCQRALPEDVSDDTALIDRVYSDFLGYYKIHSLDKTAPYSGIAELIKALRACNIKTAVITNKEQTAAKKIIDCFFDGLFDVVIGQSDGLPTKPHPAGTLKAIEMLGITKDEALFVGDSCVDMQTAANAGVLSIGVLWGFRDERELKENGAKYIVSSPEQILKIVNK